MPEGQNGGATESGRPPELLDDWVKFTVRVPQDWIVELHAAAKANGVSMAALTRMALRAFLRGRYE